MSDERFEADETPELPCFLDEAQRLFQSCFNLEVFEMHDSRGAALKKGDRVLIEAEITQLNEGGDENYCCVDVQVVTPDQPDKKKVMEPPLFSALSTKMLTKIGATVCLLFAIAMPALAQDGILTEIQSLKANNNMILANLTRMKADVANLQTSIDSLTAKVDAMSKSNVPSSPAVKSVWQPAIVGAWGQTVQPGRFVSVSVDTSGPVDPPIPMQAATTMIMSGGSGSACANGSCSSGRMGLFGRRR